MADATRTISTRLRLESEAEYNNAIKAIKNNMSLLRSEMVLLEAQHDGQRNSYEFLTEKGGILNRQLAEQQKIYEEAKKQLQAYVTECDKLTQSIKDESAAYEKIKGTSEDTAEAQKKHADTLAKLDADYAKAANSVTHFQKEFNYAGASVEKTNHSIAENNKYLDETGRVAGGAATSIDEYGKSVKQAAESADELGDKSQAAINALASALAAAGVAKGIKEISDALRDCVQSSVDFETAMAGVRRTVGGSDADISAFADKFKELSTIMPISTGSLAKIAETAGQLGIARDNVTAFTEVMAKLGTATDITSEQAATMLAQFANITGLDPSNYERMGSVVASLGDATATTASKVVEMSQGMAAAASVAGFSETDIMALAAAVGSLGIETQAGATSMSRLITALQKAVETGDKLNEFADIAGVSATEFAQLWGDRPVEALNAFIQGLNDTERNGKTALVVLDEMGLSEVRLSRAITSLAESGDLLSGTIAQGNKAWAENTALTEKAGIMYSTTEAKAQMLKNGVDNLKIAIGDQLKPAMNDLIDTGADLTDWADEFISQNEWLVPAITATSTALGVFAGGLTTIAVVSKAASAAMAVFNSTVAANPVVLATAAIVALTAAVATLALTVPEAKTESEKLAKQIREIKDAAVETKKAYEDTTDAIKKNADDTAYMVSRLDELVNKTGKTASETAIMLDLINKLNESVPELNLEYDNLTGTLNRTAEAVREIAAAERERARINADIDNYIKLDEQMKEAKDALKKAQEEYNQALADYENLSPYAKRQEELDLLSDAVTAAERNIKNASAALKEISLLWSDAGDVVDRNAELTEQNTKAIEQNADSVEDLGTQYQKTLNALSDFSKSMDTAMQNANSLRTALDNMSQAGHIDSESLKTIISLYPEAISYINDFAAMTEFASGKIAEQEDAAVKAYGAIVTSSADAINTILDNSSTLPGRLASYYGEDYQNFVKFSNGKYNVEAETVMQLSALWAEYAGTSLQSINQQIRALERLGKRGASDSEFSKELNELYLVRDMYAALEKDFEKIGGGLFGSSNNNSGGGGKAKTQAERDLEAFKEAYAELKELRKNDEISAMEYYNRVSEFAEKYLQDPANLSKLREVSAELKTVLDSVVADAITAVTSGYLTLEQAAEVFGLTMEQITERHSLAVLYDKQMQDAVTAVKKGGASVYDAMKQFGVGYDELTAALEAYNSDMRKLYDEQRDIVDYYYKTGLMTAEEYYAKLAELRNLYLAENSEAWRMASVELYNLNKDIIQQLEDDRKAAEEKLQAELEARVQLRKEQIDEELSLEKERLNAIIEMINAEIQARRNLRADEAAEDKIAKAKEKVLEAQKALDAAMAELDYARDENERAEAEKLVLQREKALKTAQEAVRKAEQDYEDQLWYRQKQAEIDAVKASITAAEQEANALKDNAEAYVRDEMAREREELERQKAEAARAAEAAAIEAATATAATAALLAGLGAVAAGMGSVAQNISKSASVNVTYSNASATSGQISNIVQKVLDKL